MAFPGLGLFSPIPQVRWVLQDLTRPHKTTVHLSALLNEVWKMVSHQEGKMEVGSNVLLCFLSKCEARRSKFSLKDK